MMGDHSPDSDWKADLARSEKRRRASRKEFVKRGTWVIRNGELVEKGGPKDIRPQPARSDLPCPMLVSDIMDAAEHPSDGKFYTSKSGFRRTTKANGLIEVGNDAQRFNRPKRPDRDKAIERSIDRAIARAS